MKKILTALAIIASPMLTFAAQAKEQLNVAYFLQWATPNQIAQMDKTFDKKMEVDVNWRAFDTGVAMSAAMASGDIDIAYSQGVAPFVIAVSSGLPFTTVGVAVSYADNDNCVVYKDAGITKKNAKDLEGKRVAVPFGTVPYYKVLKQFEYLGVDHAKVKLVDMPPNEGAAALSRGDVAMACGFGGGFFEMLKYGEVLMTPQELADIGVYVFDVVSVTNSFAREHPEMVTQFLQITEDSNRMYARNPGDYYDALADASGQSQKDTARQLKNFVFPGKDEVLDKWFNGNVAAFYKGVADTLYRTESIDAILSDYSGTVDRSFMTQVR